MFSTFLNHQILIGLFLFNGVEANYAFNTVETVNAINVVNTMIFIAILSIFAVDDWGVIDYIHCQGEKPTNLSPKVIPQSAIGAIFLKIPIN
jgi:hypothetical protein